MDESDVVPDPSSITERVCFVLKPLRLGWFGSQRSGMPVGGACTDSSLQRTESPLCDVGALLSAAKRRPELSEKLLCVVSVSN